MLHQSSVDGPVASTSSAHPPQPKPPAIKYATLDEVLEDLSSRFILNLPDEELVSVERICFQVEQAHWYYEDFIRDANPSFPGMALKTFSRHLFEACPLLQHWSKDHDQAFQDFLAYKTSVPVCGVIMLNSSYTKCVLVKGWKSSSSWTFPRGKINADEPEHECAAREALEETGYDVTDKIHKDLVIRTTLKEQETSLFIVPNVPEDTVFIPQTRKEISKVDWFLLADLPGWKKGPVKDTSHKFYAINPIISALKTLLKGLKKEQWERENAAKAARKQAALPVTSGSITSAAQDPAIVSMERPTEDHLSRLLGGLDLFNASPAQQPPATVAATASKPTPDGSLPTPQATPSTTFAKKTPLPPASSLEAPHPQAPASPPSSGTGSINGTSVQPTTPQRPSKFEFFSPFDALASRPNASPSSPVVPRSSASSSSTRASTLDETSSASENSAVGTPAPSSAPSAAGHFAPASLARARLTRARQTSISSSLSFTSTTSTSSMSQPIDSPTLSTIPERRGSVVNRASPDKQSKHLALLQSLASDVASKSAASTPSVVHAPLPPDTRSGPAPSSQMQHAINGTSMNGSQSKSLYDGPAPPLLGSTSYAPMSSTNFRMSGLASFPYSTPSYLNGLHHPPMPPQPSSYMFHPTPHAPPMVASALVNGTVNGHHSDSRSVTPRGVKYPRREGGGAGSPIPVVPPAQPMQRSQLLSLLNGAPAGATANGIVSLSNMPNAPTSLGAAFMDLQPPQLGRKTSQVPAKSPPPHLNAPPATSSNSLLSILNKASLG